MVPDGCDEVATGTTVLLALDEDESPALLVAFTVKEVYLLFVRPVHAAVRLATVTAQTAPAGVEVTV